MDSRINWDGNQKLLNALRLAHDEARAAFGRAKTEEGPIAHAAKRAAQLYLPHFEREEKALFPVLELVPELAQGHVRLEMAKLLPPISQFGVRHDPLKIEHQWILSAVDDLLRTAHMEKNKELVDIAHTLKEHERIEDEVAYPAAMMIGNYLRKMLEM
jgi:hypothetical protein